MQLVIAEKPSVGKAIANVLGITGLKKDGYIECKDYIVTWCVGHLVDLVMPEEYDERYKKWSFDTLPIIPDTWKFGVSPSTSKQYKVVKELMNRKDVDEIICATDAGREGECIFRYVYNHTKCSKPFKRLWISSVEDKAIRDGMENLRNSSDFDSMFAAGLCRAEADWLVGMNLSRLFTCRYGSKLTVGRVQTPTLAMIVKRDSDIKNFVKQKFFTVELDCGTFTVSSARIDNENTADSLVTKCNSSTAIVTSVDTTIKKVNPPKLYDLTTLQREANRQYGYTAQQTLDYLQSLYEKKLATYPRTDSQFLTEDMNQTALNVIDTIYSSIPEFKPKCEFEPNIKHLMNNKKVSDHHAIIPTVEIANRNLDELPDGEKNILLLIAAKLITAAAPVHKYESVKITVNCENTDFTATGKTILESGFKAVEKQLKAHLKGSSESNSKVEDNEKILPDVTQGQSFDNVSASSAEHFTSPPKPFTEDTLLSAMETAGNSDYDENSNVEKKGLGTPATRAGIIEQLVKRGYIERNKKQISATETGASLIEVVPDKVKSPKFTAEWETRLQAIEKGKESDTAFMNDIEDYIREIVKEYSSTAENSVLSSERSVIGKCPKCGKNVIEFPKSYSCESGKDGCGFVIWKEISGKKISSEAAKQLLQNDKTGLIKGFTSKSGKNFDCCLKLDTENKIVFDFGDLKNNKENSIGNCPHCGKDIIKGKFGFYCTGKCGMSVSKVYGKELTETQLSKLLSGKSITYTHNDRKTTVLPEAEPYSYNEKSGFQWKTKKEQ